jgi:hypothetical protein
MPRKAWLALVPSLLVGVGIVVATLIAVWTAESGWLVLAGPLCLALSVLGADVVASRLKGESSSTPSWPALLLAGSFLLAGWIVALRDPNLVKTLILAIGVTAWAPLQMRPESRRRACRRL